MAAAGGAARERDVRLTGARVRARKAGAWTGRHPRARAWDGGDDGGGGDCSDGVGVGSGEAWLRLLLLRRLQKNMPSLLTSG